MYFEKLDASKVASMGYSMGSLATFTIANDPRLTTTVHISGGNMEADRVNNLHAPAAFICGIPDPNCSDILSTDCDIAAANCDIDFMNAAVPVFYGITKGAAHMTPTDIGDATIRAHQFGAMVGWLRWQLASDANAKNMFVGAACTLCKDAAWSSIKQKDLK